MVDFLKRTESADSQTFINEQATLFGIAHNHLEAFFMDERNHPVVFIDFGFFRLWLGRIRKFHIPLGDD